MSLQPCEYESINNAKDVLPSSIIIEPTFEEHVSNYQNITGYYKIGSRVYLNIGCYLDNVASISGDTLLFTLPIGYRPSSIKYAVLRGYSNFQNLVVLRVNTDGTVLFRQSDDKGGMGYIEFDAFS